MFQPLDGPSRQLASTSLTTTTVVKVGLAGVALEERKVVTIQPISGNIYIYFGDDSTTPNATTVAADGFIQTKNTLQSYEASASQNLFILSVSGTIQVKIVERA